MKGKSWKSWSLRDGEAVVLPGPLVSLLGFPVLFWLRIFPQPGSEPRGRTWWGSEVGATTHF